MQNKLSSLFTLMALVTLILTWFLRWMFDLPHMRPELGLTVLCAAMITYYFFGKAISWIGVSLVQEELAEKRAREDGLRHQLSMLESEANRSGGSAGGSAAAPTGAGKAGETETKAKEAEAGVSSGDEEDTA